MGSNSGNKVRHIRQRKKRTSLRLMTTAKLKTALFPGTVLSGGSRGRASNGWFKGHEFKTHWEQQNIWHYFLLSTNRAGTGLGSMLDTHYIRPKPGKAQVLFSIKPDEARTQKLHKNGYIDVSLVNFSLSANYSLALAQHEKSEPIPALFTNILVHTCSQFSYHEGKVLVV